MTSWDNRNRTHNDPAAFEHDVLLDAWHYGNAVFWTRRARQLEAARPRRGDYPGRATPNETRTRWDRLTNAATACRNRAAFLDATLAEFEDTTHDLDMEATA